MIDQFFLILGKVEAPVIAAAAVFLPLLFSYHIIMTKKDVRAAIGWVGLVWLVPFVGAFLYLLLGINRIQRKAARVRLSRKEYSQTHSNDLSKIASIDSEVSFHKGFASHIRLVDKIGRMPMTSGNMITPLNGAEQAFPAMIDAINNAKKNIVLASFIFGSDEVGKSFSDALVRAAERGVTVRVLIDGLGEFYSWPLASRSLRKAGVKVARFNKSLLPWRMAYFNLRNHRKIMIIDGKEGFTGGINLRSGRGGRVFPERAIRDFHFHLLGPIVEQMMAVFLEDWKFSTKENIELSQMMVGKKAQHSGGVLARGLPDGPDEDIDKVSWVLQSILGAARKNIKIITPYFLPDRLLLRAINFASLRGVDVEIYLPVENNLPFVSWAAEAQYDQLLKGGCKIFLTEPPFDHSKLMVVDNEWVLFGSTNWDPRSLRLNFEFNVECFDKKLAELTTQHISALKQGASEVTLSMAKNKNPWIKLRNGIAWLFSPYL